MVTMLSLFLLAGLRSLLNLFGDSYQNLGQFLGLRAGRLEALKISDSLSNSNQYAVSSNSCKAPSILLMQSASDLARCASR